MKHRRQTKGYQRDFSRLHADHMHDETGRRYKAQKALVILRDFLARRRLMPSRLCLLDIGASTGILTHLYGENFANVVGVDIDQHGIDYATKHYAAPNTHFLIGDSMQLPFAECSFDVVACTHIYEHVPDAQRLLTEIERVLKPGGCCFFSAGNRLSWMEPHYRLPLLSVVPKWLAHHYLRWKKMGDHYYETHLTYWGLRRLVSRFDLTDYTLEVIRDPERFVATDMIRPGGKMQRFTLIVLRLAYWLCPTYLWVLRKPERR